MPDNTPAPPDGATIRAARVATARRLLHARLDARRVVYVGKSLDEAIYHLYAEAGEPYGGGLLGLTLWLDEQGEAPDDRP